MSEGYHKEPNTAWRSSKPSLKQAEAVIMIMKAKNIKDLPSFSDIMENWTSGECSDYIGNKGDGSLYKLKKD